MRICAILSAVFSFVKSNFGLDLNIMSFLLGTKKDDVVDECISIFFFISSYCFVMIIILWEFYREKFSIMG